VVLAFSVLVGSCLDRPVAPATPSVNARIVKDVRQEKVSKIDLLFMIDNSSSMADKQAILAQAVPDLLSRLVDPVCIDPVTGQQVGIRDVNGACARGEPDFEPVKDIHVGIITSSLGGHGTTGICDDPDPQKTFPHNNDKAHLVARDTMDVPVPTFMNEGFLSWNRNADPAQAPASVTTPFTTMVQGVGQHGCGYEASLESIYRFLIEPDPYDTVTAVFPGPAQQTGRDTVLLKQRADFLRPDSLVAVMLISDENDCSVVDYGQGYYSIFQTGNGPSVLSHGTTPCLANPNDKCCFNCGQKAPAGCADPGGDPECMAGAWTADKDPANLRCWNQKQRYGVDFLYPVGRYIAGFRNSKISNNAGTEVKNPLYSDLTPACVMSNTGCLGERDKSLVFVAGIVGVPWQDIAVDPNDLNKGYLTSTQITAMNVWSKILGVPQDPNNPNAAPVLPSDPHMIESIVPRAGIAPPDSAANADPINGHEWNIAMASPQPNADLQYACVFPIPPKTCTQQQDCDCFVANMANAGAAQNPLCQNGNAYSTTQVRAKGYPGIRELQVLQGLDEQAVVASVCPSNTTTMGASDYGYRPVISAIVNRIRNPLRGVCVSVN
jgi:hypothetical protein